MIPVWLSYVIAYAASTVGGWLVVGAFLKVIRWTVGLSLESFKWLDFWIGSAERTVAISLVVWAPDQLPPFVGGWIALKFAANWQRQASNGPKVRQGSLIALIGSVLSFTVAIVAGCFLHPEVISHFAK